MGFQAKTCLPMAVYQVAKAMLVKNVCVDEWVWGDICPNDLVENKTPHQELMPYIYTC
jgi:hypothetical protein